MATPPNDDSKVLFKLLVDRQWHRYIDVVDAIAKTVPPGRALRKYIQDRKHDKNNPYRHHNDPDPNPRKSDDERIEAGQKSCARTVVSSWKRQGVVLMRGERDGREIRVRDGWTTWGIPGFEPSEGQNPASAQQGPTESPPAVSEPSEVAPPAVVEPTMADVFASLDVTRAQPVESPAAKAAESDLGPASVWLDPPVYQKQAAPLAQDPEPAVRVEEPEQKAQDVNRVSPEGGLFAPLEDPTTCELCGLTVGNWARHEQWHNEQKQADTPPDMALLNESQLRSLIRDELGRVLDRWQDGLQGYLGQQFTQLEDVFLAARRPTPRWMDIDR